MATYQAISGWVNEAGGHELAGGHWQTIEAASLDAATEEMVRRVQEHDGAGGVIGRREARSCYVVIARDDEGWEDVTYLAATGEPIEED